MNLYNDDEFYRYLYQYKQPAQLPDFTIIWAGATPIKLFIEGVEFDIRAMAKYRE